MRKPGLVASLALAACISVSSCKSVQTEALEQPEFSKYLQVDRNIRLPKPEENNDVYYDSERNYYYYYKGKLHAIGSDKEFAEMDARYLAVKFGWAGRYVVGVFNSGTKVLFKDMETGTSELIDMQPKLADMGLKRMDVTQLMVGDNGAYFTFSKSNSVFYLEFEGSEISMFRVPITHFLHVDESSLFLPQIMMFNKSLPAIVIDSYSNYCQILIYKTDAGCKQIPIDEED